jgi:NAD(P)-dependent dehydrogenase (short-subunit alcohol dehydrogenase family)
MSQQQKVWFITGISRGFGLALARTLLAQGHTVVGTTRDGTSALDAGAGTLHVVALDVTDRPQVDAAVEQAHRLAGRIDVVVNNAGYGLLGAVEEVGDDQVRHLFEVNFFGALHVTQAALPIMRAQRSGHFVNISSVAGRAPAAGAALYAASKCALAGMSEGLAGELAPLGIGVTIVEPGAFRTDFLEPTSLRTTAHRIDDYASTSGANLDRLDALAGKQMGDPDKAAWAIIEAVGAPHPPLHLVLGADSLERSRANIANLVGDLDRWEHVTRETAFPDA